MTATTTGSQQIAYTAPAWHRPVCTFLLSRTESQPKSLQRREGRTVYRGQTDGNTPMPAARGRLLPPAHAPLASLKEHQIPSKKLVRQGCPQYITH